MLTLASKGRTTYQIMPAQGATDIEKLAARELAYWLHVVTGAKFKISTSARAKSGPVLAVGPDAALQIIKKLPGELGDEGVLLRRVGKDVVLTGAQGSKRGTLYAVYVFLEEVAGIRWFTPEVTRASSIPVLRIGALNRCVTPSFPYRELMQVEAWDEKWAARNRTNGEWERKDGARGLPEAWGGHRRYHWFVHSFARDDFITPKRYFKKHPDWFSMINGKRVDTAQLCLTNNEMTDEACRLVLAGLRKNPDVQFISISQNDNYGNCQCENCRKSDAKYRASGTLLNFLNTIADAVADEFPNVLVDTLAYQYTRLPPKGVKPRANVALRICAFENDMLHTLDHGNNAVFYKDMSAWAALTPHLTIWHYMTNYAHSVMTFPNWFVFGKDIKILKRLGLYGCFLQSNQYSRGGEMGNLRMWVASKLMWNHRQSPEALIQEFLNGVYGKGGAHIFRYMRMIHQAARRLKNFPGSIAIVNSLKRSKVKIGKRVGCVLDINSPANAPFLSPALLVKALSHFDAALAATENTPSEHERVMQARMAVIYPVLLRWDEIRTYTEEKKIKWPLLESRQAECRKYVGLCRKHNIGMLGEGWSKRTPEWLTRVCAGEEWAEFP